MLLAPVSFDKNRILRSFSTSILSPRACTSSRSTRKKILRTLLQCHRTSVRSFPIPIRASRRVARQPRLSSTRDESSFLLFWREEVKRHMVSLAKRRYPQKVTYRARASKERKGINKRGVISLSKIDISISSPLDEDSANKRLWVLIPPSAFCSRTSLSAIVESPPRKITANTATRKRAATKKSVPPRVVWTLKSASTRCVSCRPFCKRRRFFSFPSTAARSVASSPRRRREPGSGRDDNNLDDDNDDAISRAGRPKFFAPN